MPNRRPRRLGVQYVMQSEFHCYLYCRHAVKHACGESIFYLDCGVMATIAVLLSIREYLYLVIRRVDVLNCGVFGVCEWNVFTHCESLLSTTSEHTFNERVCSKHNSTKNWMLKTVKMLFYTDRNSYA